MTFKNASIIQIVYSTKKMVSFCVSFRGTIGELPGLQLARHPVDGTAAG